MKQLFKKSTNEEDKNIFPKPSDDHKNAVISTPANPGNFKEEFIKNLGNNKEILDQLSEIVIPKILQLLCEEYDFTPTEKYKQQIEEKQKYLNQMDSYLEERKAINDKVNNDLKNFLDHTQSTLSKQLQEFANGVIEQITQAENRHGIAELQKVFDIKSEASEG